MGDIKRRRKAAPLPGPTGNQFLWDKTQDVKSLNSKQWVSDLAKCLINSVTSHITSDMSYLYLLIEITK